MRTVLGTLAAMAIMVLAWASTSMSMAMADEQPWLIDSNRSEVSFKIRHLMVSDVLGCFHNVSGTAHFDPARLASATVDAKIGADSIDTQMPARDRHLKEKSVLDVDRFPYLEFRSSKIVPHADGTFDIDGTLTMHGVSGEVILHAQPVGQEKADSKGQFTRTVLATAELNRKNFGVVVDGPIDRGGTLIGDKVRVMLNIVLVRSGNGKN